MYKYKFKEKESKKFTGVRKLKENFWNETPDVVPALEEEIYSTKYRIKEMDFEIKTYDKLIKFLNQYFPDASTVSEEIFFGEDLVTTFDFGTHVDSFDSFLKPGEKLDKSIFQRVSNDLNKKLKTTTKFKIRNFDKRDPNYVIVYVDVFN